MSEEPEAKRPDADYCRTVHFTGPQIQSYYFPEGFETRALCGTWCMTHKQWIASCAYEWFLLAKALDPTVTAGSLQARLAHPPAVPAPAAAGRTDLEMAKALGVLKTIEGIALSLFHGRGRGRTRTRMYRDLLEAVHVIAACLRATHAAGRETSHVD